MSRTALGPFLPAGRVARGAQYRDIPFRRLPGSYPSRSSDAGFGNCRVAPVPRNPVRSRQAWYRRCFATRGAHGAKQPRTDLVDRAGHQVHTGQPRARSLSRPVRIGSPRNRGRGGNPGGSSPWREHGGSPCSGFGCASPLSLFGERRVRNWKHARFSAGPRSAGGHVKSSAWRPCCGLCRSLRTHHAHASADGARGGRSDPKTGACSGARSPARETYRGRLVQDVRRASPGRRIF